MSIVGLEFDRSDDLTSCVVFDEPGAGRSWLASGRRRSLYEVDLRNIGRAARDFLIAMRALRHGRHLGDSACARKRR